MCVCKCICIHESEPYRMSKKSIGTRLCVRIMYGKSCTMHSHAAIFCLHVPESTHTSSICIHSHPTANNRQRLRTEACKLTFNCQCTVQNWQYVICPHLWGLGARGDGGLLGVKYTQSETWTDARDAFFMKYQLTQRSPIWLRKALSGRCCCSACGQVVLLGSDAWR